MKAYKQNKMTSTKIKVNKSYEGETIEAKIRRILNNKEPITDTAPLVYTDRKDGVLPDYDIRTDRFEVAIEAMDIASKSQTAKREMRIGERTYDTMTETQQKEFNEKYPTNKHAKKNSGAEPSQGTTTEK